MGAIPTSIDERVALLKKLQSPYYRGLNDDQLHIIAEPARLIEARVRFIKPGIAFRFAYLGVASKYCVSAQAATNVRVLRWEIHDTLRLLQESPSIALNSVAVLQQMLVDLIETLNWFTCGSAEERLFWVVRRLAEGLCEGDCARLPVTQGELAASTGLSLYIVNRILKSWEQRGMVERHRHALVIWPKKLASIC